MNSCVIKSYLPAKIANSNDITKQSLCFYVFSRLGCSKLQADLLFRAENFDGVVIVEDNAERGLLAEAQFCAGLIPQLATGGTISHLFDHRRGDAIHHDDACRTEIAACLRHDFLELTIMATDEDGIREAVHHPRVRWLFSWQSVAIYFEEVAHNNLDTWGAELSGILLDDRLALRTYLEGENMQMRIVKSGFYGDATSTGSDVPKLMAVI